ncbi:MAG TPA: 16S rRNA (cytosine(967)-C(5))-methyltransferase RsmB [Methylococcaceae bacterium]|nr:16S rRNA (cytosine(967)-C(5))-methyltransferase RsmB [Methylococcaceae bacterium]
MNTRGLAAQTLVRVIGERRSLTAALEAILSKIPQENDRAFVQALCFGAMRWYWRLDFFLRQLAAKPIRDEEIRTLALLGLYQLEYTRVKPYAAVAETVAAAAGRKRWAKPFLNGLLRSYQRERERLQTLADADESASLSYPLWLIEQIRRDWPEDFAAILSRGNLQAPLVLRVNRLKCERARYLEWLAEAEIAARPCDFAESAAVLENPVAVERLPGFGEGWVSVQDEAAQLAAGLLDTQPGQRVLDVCAAPGGKTLHLLESCPDAGEVVALDIAPERVGRIRENLSRAGVRATVLTANATEPSTWWDGKPFDRILLDAPCSATGVIRRHPDIKLLRQPEDIAQLQTLQRRILEAVWPLLAEGGVLLYATCSILRRENEAQIADFLGSHPQAREMPITADWGRSMPCGRQILTGEAGMDGFYYARLCK